MRADHRIVRAIDGEWWWCQPDGTAIERMDSPGKVFVLNRDPRRPELLVRKGVGGDG